MKSIFRLFVLILLIAGWGLAALSLHVIRTPDQMPITLITKERMGIEDIWVDTTKWTLEDVKKHPIVVERLIRTGRADLLIHVVDPDGADVEQQLSDALERDPRNRNYPRDAITDQLARRQFRWPWEGRTN